MSVPPELMAMLQGQAPQAAPQDAPDPAAAEDNLRQAIDLLQKALQAEPDDQDSAALAAIVKQLYSIAVGRQKEQDQALAGKFSPRMMRRGV
jgi:hypothetical protein